MSNLTITLWGSHTFTVKIKYGVETSPTQQVQSDLSARPLKILTFPLTHP